MAGDGERRSMRQTVEPIGAANGDADAGNGQGIADGDLVGVAAIRAGVMRAGAGAASLSSATSAVARWANRRLMSNCG